MKFKKNIMEIYCDNYVNYIYKEEDSLVEEYWYAESENMSEEELRDIMLILVNFFYEKKPKLFFSDMRNFLFVIHPDLQVWIDEVVSSVANKSMTKIARTMSSDFISQISLEQFFEEKHYSRIIKNKFFDNKKDAIDWLLE
ncbi:MAG: hypothetical protein B6I24_05240 [Bacteroidetes bacterium 4572_128]|nr:MAG: hypothetical protein B6I24_05240 [Bacteroidetes bacterium 4572_128]